MAPIDIKIICCPMCGGPLRNAGQGGSDYQPREGIEVALAYYPRGFFPGAYVERFHWRAEVCRRCGGLVREKLEPARTLIIEKDITR